MADHDHGDKLSGAGLWKVTKQFVQIVLNLIPE